MYKMAAAMTTPIQPHDDPQFATKLRRLSRSGFLTESNKLMPRLGVMVAHIQLFDSTTRAIEEELARQRENTLAQKRLNESQPKPARRGRPKLGARSDSAIYTPSSTEQLTWIKELTLEPREGCVYVTEVEDVEDTD